MNPVPQTEGASDVDALSFFAPKRRGCEHGDVSTTKQGLDQLSTCEKAVMQFSMTSNWEPMDLVQQIERRSDHFRASEIPPQIHSYVALQHSR
jgi:hypothetical protein